jgi:hypothetical protein
VKTRLAILLAGFSISEKCDKIGKKRGKKGTENKRRK